MSENEWKKRTHTIPMKGGGQPIESAIGELYAQVDGIDSRLFKLEKGPGDPVTGRAFEGGTPAPELLVPVDRHTGIIGGEEAQDLEGSAPRALERRDLRRGQEEVLPEYYVPVDRHAGSIGGDE